MRSDKKLSNYKNNLPHLNLETFLNNEIRGYGIIETRFGIVKRRFEFLANCSWIDGTCYLKEEMKYDNGFVDKRIWLIERQGESYRATTNNVIGFAEINIGGNSMNWRYKINIPFKSKNISISCDDWMYLIDDRRLINRNTFKKFGFKVGELTLFMEKI